MKRFWLAACLILFLAFPVTAQTVTDRAAIYNEAVSQFYADTPRALKTAEYLLKKAESNEQKADALYLLSEISTVTGDYPKATELLFEAKETAGRKTPGLLTAKIALGFAKQCRIMGIYDKAGVYLKEAREAVPFSKEMQFNIKEEAALIALAKGQKNITGILGNNTKSIVFLLIKGQPCLQQNKYKEAALYFNEGLKNGNAREKLLAANGLAQIALLQKEYQKAINLLLPVAAAIKASEDAAMKLSTYKTLSDSYYNLNDLQNYIQYSNLYDGIYTECDNNKSQARILFINHLDKEYDQTFENQNNNSNLWIGSIAIAVCILGVSGLCYLLALKRSYKQYVTLSQVKLLTENNVPEIIPQTEEPTPPAEKEIPEAKQHTIPEKTEKTLLEKLARFENSGKFTNNSISLNGLAKQLDTNTKYLSEVINTHKNGNFNTYINELRIKYILKKLQTDPVYLNYKVSYLAEEAGFSSHSLFATVFKTVTGISPTTYIGFLKKETENRQNA